MTRQSTPYPPLLLTMALLTHSEVTFREIHTLLGFWGLPLQTARVSGCRLLRMVWGGRGGAGRS